MLMLREMCDWAGSVGGGLTLWNAEGIWDSTDGRIKFFQTEEEKQAEA